MIKLLLWLGLFVGTPSVAAYESLAYQDHFVVFFAFCIGIVLLAILPLFGEPDRH